MKKYYNYLGALALVAALVTTPLTSSQAKVAEKSLTHQVKETDATLKYEKKKLIIQTSKGLSAAQLKKIGATVNQRISELNYTVLQFKTEKTWKKAIETLATTEGVEKIALSPIYKQFAVSDPKASKQYMHNLLQSTEAQKLIGKTKIKVAIIDGGIDGNHPELKSQIKLSKNMVNPLHSVVESSHGTHVAGIVGALKGNGIGGFGMNPTVQLLGYDVFDGQEGAYDYIIAKAILQATKDGAKVINMSLGSSSSSAILADAVQYAIEKGVTVVAAAGNESTDEKQYPASYEGVISVGSVNNDSKLSDFSSYGVSVDVVAPGEDIYSSSYEKRGSSFENMSGTSMASPVVAGIASLILSKNPTLSAKQIEYILERSATDLGDKGFDVKYGNGLVNPLAALKFKTDKIPKLTTKKWTDEEILNGAKDARFNEDIQDQLTIPSEEKWVRLDVHKGQPIQLSAIGDKFADLKLAVHFYNGMTSQKMTYDEAKENQSEAKFIEAPFDGKMTVGVSDVNGLVSSGNYHLKILSMDFPEDESSRDAVAEIESLNSTITDQYMQPIEGGDEDVLHFKATKDELVQIELSAIPGVKTAIQLYSKKAFLQEELPEATQSEDVSLEPLAQVNNMEQNTPSTISFETKKDEEYYIVLSNLSTPELTIDLLIQMLESGQILDLTPKPEASLFPYSVTMQSKDAPGDEDQFGQENTGDLEDGVDESDMQAQYETYGRPFDLTKTTAAYLNGSNDLDGYYFTTSSSAIYQLAIQNTLKAAIPTVTLYEVKKELNDKNILESMSEYVTDNYNEYAPDGKTMMMGLKANTTYLLEVIPNVSGIIPFDGYTLEAKLLKTNSEDKYEPNNIAEKATTINNNQKVIGNFATFNDGDFYYFTPEKSGLFSIDYQFKNLTATDKADLPEKLRNKYLTNLTIIHDKNNNKRLDDNEMDRFFNFTDMANDLSIHGSFEMTKGENYFIFLNASAYQYFTFSALPYELRIQQVVTKDEDAGNKVKKNTPTKPIKLTQKSKNIFEKSAYMNTGYKNGDEDWFVYTSKAKQSVQLTLSLPQDLDGVVEVYKDGKSVAKSDYYGAGDSESLSLKVTKGKYYIKVTERFKNASIEKYKLTIKK